MEQPMYLVLLLLGAWSLQGVPPGGARGQIGELIHSFDTAMAQGRDPSPFLSPKVTGKARDEQILTARKRYTSFDISGFLIDRDLIFQGPNHATLKAWAGWNTPHLGQESQVTIRFEKVGGVWYFASFDFLAFNWLLTVLGSAIGVLYAAAGLSFLLHWRKQKFPSALRRYAWGAVLFTPIGWILYPIYKPWKQPAGTA